MSPFDLLGLATDADERTIKRAYAQRLRVTRPEDDPDGFQQLHAAYQSALEYCREMTRRPLASLPEAVLDEAPPRQPAPMPITPAAPSRFNPDAFCHAAFARATAGDALALQAWLTSQPELWSLQLKSQTGHYVMQQLYQYEPPMSADCMETLLRFFDLDHALAGHNPLALLQLGRRMRLAWQLEVTDKDVLTSRLAIRTSSQRWRVHWIVRQLKRPFGWPRVLFVGMNSANAGLIADFADSVSDNHPEDLPAAIDRAQLNFWRAAAERPQITRPRLILGAARSAAILVLATLLAPLLSQLFTGGMAPRSMLTAIGWLMIPSVLWLLWMAWSLLDQWHIQGGSLPQDRSARMYLVPALCASGVILDVCGRDEIGLLLIVPALWLAVRRYWYQHPSRYAFFRSGNVRLVLLLSLFLLRAVLGAKFGDDVISLGETLAAVALLAWAVDLHKQYQARAG